MFSRLDNSTLSELKGIVGSAGWSDDSEVIAPHISEWRGLFSGSTPIMLMPDTTGEVAAILRCCNERGIGIVPQGGNTGLAGGAIPHSKPDAPEILLSASRLNRIRELDAENFTLTAEAGCVLATLQQAAAAADRLFPLSLAAEGSCQIGGNISTNAGGTNVMRYGNVRESVLGLEVVLPNGRIVDGLRGLRKDNTGYDLKQLFIGAEGTLGFITAAVCKLFPLPRSSATALLAVDEPRAAVDLFTRAQLSLGDELTAIEIFPRLALDMVLAHIDGCRDPFDKAWDWYLLIEIAGVRDQADTDQNLTGFLDASLAAGVVRDGVIAQSGTQRADLWRLRHSISEAQRHAGASIKNDISVPVARVAQFIDEAASYAAQRVTGVRPVAFGHLGDGNIHFNLSQPEAMPSQEFLDLWDEITAAIHTIAVQLGGSFSAEHGIGALKTGELVRLRSEVELDLMRAIKQAVDPRGIMNPGKVLER